MRRLAAVCAAVAAFDALPGEAPSAAEATRLVGDEESWFALFTDKPQMLADGFSWPEGPSYVEGTGLLFTDTIANKIYRWDDAKGEAEVFLDHGGGCGGPDAPACDESALEPGPNGLSKAFDYVRTKPRGPATRMAVCQHGARRLAFLDLELKTFTDLATHYNDLPLNGPNDVASSSDGSLYFTDPYYSFLEKDRPADAYYCDDKSALGFAGIYGLEVRSGTLNLLDDSLERPNGVAVVNETHLVVSECCQGHSDTCPAGEARWFVYAFRQGGLFTGEPPKRIVHSDGVKRGCADGLTFHAPSQTLVAACPGGVCLVDLNEGEVLAKMHLGRKVSNVAFGGGFGWITAEGSLWRATLRTSAPLGGREL